MHSIGYICGGDRLYRLRRSHRNLVIFPVKTTLIFFKTCFRSIILKTLIILDLIISATANWQSYNFFKKKSIFHPCYEITEARPCSQLDFWFLFLPFSGTGNKFTLQQMHSSCSYTLLQKIFSFLNECQLKSKGYLLIDT